MSQIVAKDLFFMKTPIILFAFRKISGIVLSFPISNAPPPPVTENLGVHSKYSRKNMQSALGGCK